MLWSHRSAGDRAEHRSAPPHQQGKGCGRWSRSPDPRETSHSLLQGCKECKQGKSAGARRVQKSATRCQKSAQTYLNTWQLPGRTANGDMWQEMEARLRSRYLQKPAQPLDICRMSGQCQVRTQHHTRTKHQNQAPEQQPTRVPDKSCAEDRATAPVLVWLRTSLQSLPAWRSGGYGRGVATPAGGRRKAHFNSA